VSRRLIVPEVIQSSTTDCGPATLKAALEGHGLDVGYHHLRQICRTDVDGTSIDALEEIANEMGLRAEQTIVPTDHLMLAEAQILPAIVVMQAEGGDDLHFVIAWRRHGSRLQVMDPSHGRRWPSVAAFARDVHVHEVAVSAADFRSWAGSRDFLAPLQRRMKSLGLAKRHIDQCVATALGDPSWFSIGALDAAVRQLAALVECGALPRGSGVLSRLRTLIANHPERSIAPEFWFVRPDADAPSMVRLRGVVVVHLGTPSQPKPPPSPSSSAPGTTHDDPRPFSALWRTMRQDGLSIPWLIAIAVAVNAAALVVELVLLRGFIDLASSLHVGSQRWGAAASLLLFVGALALIEAPVALAVAQVGRRLECRVRVSFLSRLPRLSQGYFRSRLISDLASRSHSLYRLRHLPAVGVELLSSTFELLLSAAVIIWLDSSLALLGLVAAAISVGAPWLTQSILRERDLRVQCQAANLSRFHLDCLRGLAPIHAHGAHRGMRRQHGRVLEEWRDASVRLQNVMVGVETLQAALSVAIVTSLVGVHITSGASLSKTLLVVYLALQLPALGERIAIALRQYPRYRNVALRLLEPMQAPQWLPVGAQTRPRSKDEGPGTHITMHGVSVTAAGNEILRDVSLDLPAGSHIAIVGASGAGKSTLLSVLSGHTEEYQGTVRVNGRVLTSKDVLDLRSKTAWIDPSVSLWNRSLADNLRYGAEDVGLERLGQMVDVAGLRPLLERLPGGLQQNIGEGGGLVSGGEGQRIRIARAALRPDVSLVLMDEPFRGLDRTLRTELLSVARRRWLAATVLWVTHDVEGALGFDRVLVVDEGTVVEDGNPHELLQRGGCFSRLVHAKPEEQQQDAARWRRLELRDGRLRETTQVDSFRHPGGRA